MAKRKTTKTVATQPEPAQETHDYLPPETCGKTLVEGARSDWPDDDEHSTELERIARAHPGSYSQMIGRVMMGASIKSASQLFIGTSYKVFINWIRQGAQDLAEGRDTFMSRLTLDLQRATAYCAANCEITIASNPKTALAWLTRGPGRTFFSDGDWWQPQPKGDDTQQLPVDDPLAAPLVEHSESDVRDDTSVNTNIGKAVQVLEGLGVLNEHMATSLREQHALPPRS